MEMIIKDEMSKFRVSEQWCDYGLILKETCGLFFFLVNKKVSKKEVTKV